jgi:hypothetical protein
MNNPHAQRTAALIAAAKAKSQAKTGAAETAIRTLIKRNEPVTFQAVGREAGVSHSFLYNQPDLRSRIEHLRTQARPALTKPSTATPETTLVAALAQQINNLKRQHRNETQALRDALERAHGENLDLRREIARRGN